MYVVEVTYADGTTRICGPFTTEQAATDYACSGNWDQLEDERKVRKLYPV